MRFDRTSLFEFAQPRPSGRSRLQKLLEPLAHCGHPSLFELHERTVTELRMKVLEHQLRDAALPDRRLGYLPRERPHPANVFMTFRGRLPHEWIRWISWVHWVYELSLPRHLPVLLESFEALIAVEPQLQVDPEHPNRDHIVHQLADAELASKLHARASLSYDDEDWEVLEGAVAGLRSHSSERPAITACGLALAGMFHDIGYLRYIGGSSRKALATFFGLTVPEPALGLWTVTEVFGGSYLDKILGRGGLVAEVFAFGWDAQWHGPLAGYVLASVARRLRIEGRHHPVVDAVLQIAAATAFLHELHVVNKKHLRAPTAVKEARQRIAAFRWPALFRFVDELQCWFRPELGPHRHHGKHATITYGARWAEISADGKISIRVNGKRGSDEIGQVQYLLDTLPEASKALNLTSISETT